jgi:hypothetical protein
MTAFVGVGKSSAAVQVQAVEISKRNLENITIDAHK